MTNRFHAIFFLFFIPVVAGVSSLAGVHSLDTKAGRSPPGGSLIEEMEEEEDDPLDNIKDFFKEMSPSLKQLLNMLATDDKRSNTKKKLFTPLEREYVLNKLEQSCDNDIVGCMEQFILDASREDLDAIGAYYEDRKTELKPAEKRLISNLFQNRRAQLNHVSRMRPGGEQRKYQSYHSRTRPRATADEPPPSIGPPPSQPHEAWMDEMWSRH